MARFLRKRSKSHGTPPGSLIFIGNQRMDKSQMTLFVFNKDHYTEEIITDLSAWPENGTGNIKWLNICGLQDTSLIEKLGVLFNISSLVLEDTMNTDQRPKVMEDEQKLVVFLKEIEFDINAKRISSDHITIILGAGYVVTLQERPGDPFEPIRDRIRHNRGKVRISGADYLVYVLLDTLVDGYIQKIEQLGSVMEEFDEMIIKTSDKETLPQIYHFKKEISFLRKSIRPVKEIMFNLLKNDTGLIHKRTKAYLTDLDDLVNQAIETVEIYFSMANDLISIYHANMSHKVNDVMRVLTIFSSIFIPLTFLVGVYGTNFDNLPELHLKYGYFYMWGVMLVAIIGMLYFFKRKKWL